MAVPAGSGPFSQSLRRSAGSGRATYVSTPPPDPSPSLILEKMTCFRLETAGFPGNTTPSAIAEYCRAAFHLPPGPLLGRRWLDLAPWNRRLLEEGNRQLPRMVL